jgi:hypothetical protein
MKSYKINIELGDNNLLKITRCRAEKSVVSLSTYSDSSGCKLFRVNTVDLKSVNLTDKKIFRYPKLSLPRNKVDNLKTKYNLSVTRSPENADYKIISLEYIKSLLYSKWHDTVMLSKFKEYYESTKLYWDQENIENFFNSIPDTKEVAITVINELGWGQRNLPQYDVIYKLTESDSSVEYFYVDDEKHVEDIQNANDLILDVHLASLTLEDSVVLSHEDYENITRMIKSNSKDDINIALELLANCNIEKSMDIVALIFYNNHGILKDMSNNWNSVNVKALRKRLNSFIPYGPKNVRYYDRLVKSLLAEKSLTEFAFKIISIDMLNHLTTSVGFNSQSVFDIKLSDIKLKPEFQQRLKVNANGQNIIETMDTFTNSLPF